MDYDTLTETEWERVGRIWDLLDDGLVERARVEVDALLSARPGHPDLRIVNAAVSMDENEPRQALEALQGAERSADPALFFHLRALAHHELAELEAAREDALRALAIYPELAESHDLLARIYEHLGDAGEAGEHAEEAEALDPESFPQPLEVADTAFDQVVRQAIAELPAEVRKRLDEIPVIVEALPSRELLKGEDGPLSPDLLGLFVGRDLLQRRHDEAPDTPGAIYLVRRNLLRVCRDPDELKREIRITVQHEVGHLLGLDEDDLEQWGLG